MPADEPNALDLPQDQADALRHTCQRLAAHLARELEAALITQLTQARRDGYAAGYLARLSEEDPMTDTTQPRAHCHHAADLEQRAAELRTEIMAAAEDRSEALTREAYAVRDLYGAELDRVRADLAHARNEHLDTALTRIREAMTIGLADADLEGQPGIERIHEWADLIDREIRAAWDAAHDLGSVPRAQGVAADRPEIAVDGTTGVAGTSGKGADLNGAQNATQAGVWEERCAHCGCPRTYHDRADGGCNGDFLTCTCRAYVPVVRVEG